MGDPDEGIAMAFAVATLHRHADTLPPRGGFAAAPPIKARPARFSSYINALGVL
jgi:hypothetical protein